MWTWPDNRPRYNQATNCVRSERPDLMLDDEAHIEPI